MMNFRLAELRKRHNLTQQELGDILCVSYQTISKWENGTTLPDVLSLPALARIYGVTIDDFYKKNPAAYDNYAQRLAAVYEKTRKPDDFMNCLYEYKKLIKEGTLSIEDKWNYANIHQWMLEYCQNEAMKWYDSILNGGPGLDEHSFYRACACRISLLSTLGKGEEAILQQKARVDADPENPQEMDLLLDAYICAGKIQEAYDCFLQAIEKFPDAWTLYINGGEVCEKLKKYDEAIRCYDKAGEIGTFFFDELYSKAMLYEKTGDYGKACELYGEIAENLRRKGFDVEADMAQRSAEKDGLMAKEKEDHESEE